MVFSLVIKEYLLLYYMDPLVLGDGSEFQLVACLQVGSRQ